jgi:hypothetical protein
LNVDIARLLVQFRRNRYGSVNARRVLVKGRQWAPCVVKHGSARAHQIPAGSQLAKTENAAVIGLYAVQHPQRPCVHVHHDVLTRQPHLVFIPYRAGDCAQAVQPQLRCEIAIRLRQKNWRPALFQFFCPY